MSIWAQKRKNTIILAILVISIVPTAFIVFKLYYKAPTCFDNKQNQNERGVDCGGPCDLYCKGEALPPVVLWQRLFKVAPGIYTASAFIQNPNLSAGASNVPYTVRLYDADGVSIYERRGFVDIHPKYSFPVIEATILLRERTPVRMSFEFMDDPVWTRQGDELLPITIVDEILYNEKSSPRIEAYLENITVKDIDKVPVAAIVYDNNDNAIAVSKTVVDKVPGSSRTKVVFSWPEPFENPVLRKEIIILR